VSDFWRQVLLSVVDKGLLGGAALGVGYLVNLRLERVRARRAFEGEFLRERTRRLDEIYVAMLDVEGAARAYIGFEMERIEANKSRVAKWTQTSEIIDAGATLKIASDTLARKAAHYRPWVGDRLHALSVEYGNIVRDNVIEQTIPGSHDIEEIGQLEQRTGQLQAEIMAAIREGAPEAATAVINERASARPPTLASSSERKPPGAGKGS